MKSSSAVISGSLRNRLFVLLMSPMLFVSAFFTIETYTHSNAVAKAAFDKSLVILSLAVMEQSEKFSGDIISTDIIDSITNSIGDSFYYYVSTPSNALVTGYSNGPKPSEKIYNSSPGKPYLFDEYYRNIPTRAVFLKRFVDIEAYTGWVELTVWQHFGQQEKLQQHLFFRSIFRLVALILLVGIIIWFGVNYGLKPINTLQDAVRQRSIDDLNPIKTPVPSEASRLVAAMNELFQRLQKSVERRESFIANASHQLKTPLANIKGRAELAFKTEELEKKQVYIDEVLKMTDQTSRLISQMLSLLKAQSNVLSTSPDEEIEINELVKNTCEHYAPYAAKAKRELIFEATTPLTVALNSSIMLTECISNLIENALHYSYEKKSITVSVQQQNNNVIISVIDSGPGISKELHDEVTRRFYRVPGTKTNGYGLGLAIVKEILNGMGAKLAFTSPTRNQFTVSIHIPVLQKKAQLKHKKSHRK